MKKVIRPGSVIPIVLAAVAGTGLMLVGMNSMSIPATTTSSAAQAAVPVTPQQVDMALRRAGITPENLAATRLSSTFVLAVISDARTFLEANLAVLENADAAFTLAKTNYDRLRRLVEGGRATPEQRSQLSASKQTLMTARTTRESVITSLFDAATASLHPNHVITLQVIKDTKGWDLPTQYLAMTGRIDPRPRIRDALANQRISARYGTNANPGLQQFLARVNTRTDVISARIGLENTRSIELAWGNALNW